MWQMGKLAAKNEIATKQALMQIIGLFEHLGICYWLDGGWGVDVLVGKQTRQHRDIDIDFDAQHTDMLVGKLVSQGYTVVKNLRPVRIELYHHMMSYIDIHPFVLSNDGRAKQADGTGGWYEFEADYFGSALFEGKNIPCISAKGQRIFHTGYELRESDRHDIKNIDSLFLQ